MVKGRGNPKARTLLLGEKPGGDELKAGRVFVGRTGVELDKIMWKTGIDWDAVWMDNLIADAPTGDDWSVTDEDIKRNSDHIRSLFLDHSFDLVVAMGAVANRFILGPGVRADVGTVHGLLHNIQSHDVIPTSSLRGCLGLNTFSTYHPASGFHDADAYPFIMYDFYLLAALINGKWTPEPRIDKYHGNERYTLITDSDRDRKLLRSLFKRREYQYIFVDTEGDKKTPWCLTFSFEDGEGYMIRASSKGAINELKQLADTHHLVVVLHYAVHDIPVLGNMGWSWILHDVDRVLDTMVAAYNLQIEPKGLKNLAYRHCGMEMKDFLDLVGPYSFDKRLDWLLKIGGQDWGKPDEILVEEKMSSRLVKPQSMNTRVNNLLKKIMASEDPMNDEKIDIWKWWGDTYEQLQMPVIGMIGDIPTATLDDVPFDEALFYACRDADATGRVFWKLVERLDQTELWDTFIMDCRCIPSFEEMQSTGFVPNIPHFEGLITKWRGEQGRIRQELAKMIGYLINPESSQQVEKVIYDLWKMPVFKETDGGRRSTSDKAIDWLAERHPGIKLIQRSRELDKAVSSFAQVAIDKAKESDTGQGRVMGNLKYTTVVSGRPSMADPNLLAFPVRSAVGKEIRNGFEAGPGRLLGSWDLNQIEMRFMAHESGDPDLIAAYWAGADIHKETAVRMFGCRLEDVTDEQREVAKRISFGVITGIAGRGLRDQFYLNGITKYDEDDCDEFIRIWFRSRPQVGAYLESCRAEARRFGYVRESVGGRTRYLQSIHSTSKKIAAEAERASHSHKISAGAQAILKKGQAVLWPIIEQLRKSDQVDIRWILQVYDELIFEFPEGYEEVLDPIITDVLCSTVKLRVPIKAKGKWAKTWGKLK